MNIKNILKLLLLPLLLPLFSLPANAMAYTWQAGLADEGMWLPLLLQNNQEEMQRLGLKLTSEQIYSINNSSLKDAIVSFGGFLQLRSSLKMDWCLPTIIAAMMLFKTIALLKMII